MFLFGRAELMKKANGTYFPEEVALFFSSFFARIKKTIWKYVLTVS